MPAKKTKSIAGKPNGKRKRDALRQNNRAFRARMKSKTRQFRRERTKQPPGMPQGIHMKNNPDCLCGSCSRGFIKSGPTS